MTYTIYSDPGHAWCKVPIQKLKQLGIENKISQYSFVKDQSVYLEEDCDLPLFIHHLKESGIEFKCKTLISNKSSRIRNYRSYKS
jgi:hypothetical protein